MTSWQTCADCRFLSYNDLVVKWKIGCWAPRKAKDRDLAIRICGRGLMLKRIDFMHLYGSLWLLDLLSIFSSFVSMFFPNMIKIPRWNRGNSRIGLCIFPTFISRTERHHRFSGCIDGPSWVVRFVAAFCWAGWLVGLKLEVRGRFLQQEHLLVPRRNQRLKGFEVSCGLWPLVVKLFAFAKASWKDQ